MTVEEKEEPFQEMPSSQSQSTNPVATTPIKIVVIHGDPTKPNDILPGGKWDHDDFYTVQRAREALTQLEPRFSFKWLCNHDTLLEDLRNLKQRNEVDLVLQLCDEGWMNNSRMEMHVVAYLDMLDIHYTGAGPKTIAVTYDKQGVLKVAESIGIPVPRSIYVDQEEAELSSIDPHKYGLEYPVIVKPNSTDGSFGITSKSVCHNLEQIKEAWHEVRH